jgi:uncharacterized protein YjbJ (UPF0337 family)
MRYRWVFFTGLGIGFVLGTRAGRERYEQMRRVARKVADNPTVQQAAGALQAQAAGYAKTAGGKVADRAGAARAKVGGAIHDRVPGMRVRESDGPPGDGGNGRYAQAPGAAGRPPGV